MKANPEERVRTRFLRSAALALLGLVASAQAELEWKERRVVLEPAAGATEAGGEFEYVNRGKNPVRIESVRVSCGCTAMSGENDIVPPGARGSIHAVFDIGSRRGRQNVAVSVITREPEQRTYELTLEIVIKEFATVTPGFIYWKLGAEAETKTLEVSVLSGFRFVSAESTTGDFAVEIVRRADGVQLRVAPRDTRIKRAGTIRILVVQGESPPVEVLAYARVM